MNFQIFLFGESELMWVKKIKLSNEVIFVQSFSNQKETLIDGNPLSLNLEPKAFQVKNFTYSIWIYFTLI